MDNNTITTIIMAILASNGFFALLQFVITRYDTRKNVNGKLEHLERDGLRTQLLLMLLLRPNEQTEILTLAERYFRKPPNGLGGNWYMTGMFKKWLEENTILKPEWFETD